MYLESYKQLKVWQRSIELVKEVYKITDEFPKSELYGLISQMRRCSVSIPSNIAEGYKRKNIGEYIQFLSIADASAAELETQIIISKEIYHSINFSKAEAFLEEVQKMLITMIKKLNPRRYTLNPNSGQSLAEILIAISVGAILIGGTIGIMSPILRSNLETKNIQIATSLAQQYLDNLRNISEASWFNIYSPPAAKGTSSQFYLNATGTTYAIVSGATSTTIEGRNFGIYFSIENVNRDSCGAGNISSEATTTCANGPGTVGVIDDPSTQKINVHISWTQGGSLSRISYFTRSSNRIFNQTDWSGGGSQDGPITSVNNKFSTSTSIDYSATAGAIKIQGL